MNLEAGKIYRDRQGNFWKMKQLDGMRSDYYFTDETNFRTWTSDGFYLKSRVPDGWDLVAEVPPKLGSISESIANINNTEGLIMPVLENVVPGIPVTPSMIANTNDAGELKQDTQATLDQRGKRYGTFLGNATLSQQLQTILIGEGLGYTDVQVEALTYISQKLARIVNGDPNYDDNWRDIAGYAELVVKELNGVGADT